MWRVHSNKTRIGMEEIPLTTAMTADERTSIALQWLGILWPVLVALFVAVPCMVYLWHRDSRLLIRLTGGLWLFLFAVQLFAYVLQQGWNPKLFLGEALAILIALAPIVLGVGLTLHALSDRGVPGWGQAAVALVVGTALSVFVYPFFALVVSCALTGNCL